FQKAQREQSVHNRLSLCIVVFGSQDFCNALVKGRSRKSNFGMHSSGRRIGDCVKVELLPVVIVMMVGFHCGLRPYNAQRGRRTKWAAGLRGWMRYSVLCFFTITRTF